MWRSKLSGRKGALDWRPAEVGDSRGHGSIEGSPSERGEMFILETRDALKKKNRFPHPRCDQNTPRRMALCICGMLLLLLYSVISGFTSVLEAADFSFLSDGLRWQVPSESGAAPRI